MAAGCSQWEGPSWAKRPTHGACQVRCSVVLTKTRSQSISLRCNSPGVPTRAAMESTRRDSPVSSRLLYPASSDSLTAIPPRSTQGTALLVRPNSHDGHDPFAGRLHQFLTKAPDSRPQREKSKGWGFSECGGRGGRLAWPAGWIGFANPRYPQGHLDQKSSAR
jgi:hypothetical protein